MTQMFITLCGIMTIFVLFWLIKDPWILWKSLIFQLDDGIWGHIVSIIIIIFTIGAISFIILIFGVSGGIGKRIIL